MKTLSPITTTITMHSDNNNNDISITFTESDLLHLIKKLQKICFGPYQKFICHSEMRLGHDNNKIILGTTTSNIKELSRQIVEAFFHYIKQEK